MRNSKNELNLETLNFSFSPIRREKLWRIFNSKYRILNQSLFPKSKTLKKYNSRMNQNEEWRKKLNAMSSFEKITLSS